MVMVNNGMGMMDTMKSATAWLRMRVAKFERSFFSYLYERRTRKLDTALTVAKMRRSVEMMIKNTPGPPDELESVRRRRRNIQVLTRKRKNEVNEEEGEGG